MGKESLAKLSRMNEFTWHVDKVNAEATGA